MESCTENDVADALLIGCVYALEGGCLYQMEFSGWYTRMHLTLLQEFPEARPFS